MSLLSALLVNVFYQLVVLALLFPFSALTLLVGCQARRQACKQYWVLICWWWVWLEFCTSYSSSCHHHFRPL